MKTTFLFDAARFSLWCVLFSFAGIARYGTSTIVLMGENAREKNICGTYVVREKNIVCM